MNIMRQRTGHKNRKIQMVVRINLLFTSLRNNCKWEYVLIPTEVHPGLKQ